MSNKDKEGFNVTGGDLITHLSGGKNLVDGKQTWELAENNKDDLDAMKKCCDAELNTMEGTGFVAAPYYFERVAILSRKAKLYEQEVNYCKLYIDSIKAFYKKHGTKNCTDVRKGPRYKAIVKRLPKAKELFKKHKT